MLSKHPQSTKQPDTVIALGVGLLLFSVFLFTYRGGFHSVDEVSTFAVTENLVKFGTINTDQIAWTQWVTTDAEAQGFFGGDGRVYSKKGFAISLAQAPLYWLALVLPGIGMLQTVSLLNAILTAVTGMLIYTTIHRLGYSRNSALVVALLFGLGTIAWVYAKYLFSGTLAGCLLMLTMALLLAYRQVGGLWRVGLAGLSAGLTVLARANNLLLLAVFGLYLLSILYEQYSSKATDHQMPPTEKSARVKVHFDTRSTSVVNHYLGPVSIFCIGAAVAGVILLWYNFARSGNPLQTGYDLSIFSPNILLGLYKLLLSPLRGLFIYSPILLLAIPGWVMLRRRHSREAWLIAGLISLTVLLFSAWSSGEGLSWGSRFLVPIVPFFMIAIAPIIDNFAQRPIWVKCGVIVVAMLSVVIQILGVSINPWVYLNELQTQFGGEFFLERTSALTDYSTTQIIGQIQNWEAAYSDLAWWQRGQFDILAFGISLLLIVAAIGGLRLATRNTAWPVFILFPLTVGLTYFLLARYFLTDPQFGEPDNAYMQALNQIAHDFNESDRVITVAQYDYHVPMNRFKAQIPLLGFAQNEDPLPTTAHKLLDVHFRNQTDAARIRLVTVGRQPAEASNRIEALLAQEAFKATDQWIDQTRLLDYGLATVHQIVPLGVMLNDTIQLVDVAYPATAAAGTILPTTFTWHPTKTPDTDYIVFLQMLDIDGQLVAQHDGPPQGSYLPTSQWAPSETVIDRHGLSLPPGLPPGDYRLITGLYNRADGVRLTTTSGADFIDIGIVTVMP